MRACTQVHSATGFLDKLKTGKAQAAGSGFGGKGLDRLDKERDDRAKAERKAYGEPDEEKAAEKSEEKAAAPTAAAGGEDMTFGSLKVEIKRGPAPDSGKGTLGVAGAAAAARRLVQQKEEERIQVSLRAAEEAAARAGKDTPAAKQALSVVAKLNAQLRAHRLVAQSQSLHEDAMPKKPNPDSTEFHAVIPINDYPQKARWKVTNKETMVQLVDMTGASVTNKGEPKSFSISAVVSLYAFRHILRARQRATGRCAAKAPFTYRIERRVPGASIFFLLSSN